MEIKLNLPPPPTGLTYTGEYRRPAGGEWYVCEGQFKLCDGSLAFDYPILRLDLPQTVLDKYRVEKADLPSKNDKYYHSHNDGVITACGTRDCYIDDEAMPVLILVPRRWRANRGESFFALGANKEGYLTTVVSMIEDEGHNCAAAWKKGNYFKTREQAEKALQQIVKAVEAVFEANKNNQ